LEWVDQAWHGSSHVGCRTMPSFGDDHGKEDPISTALWHKLAGHNEARWLHRWLQYKALADGFDVHKVETGIATPRTCEVKSYLDHASQSIGNFQRLYEHYKQERWSRWMTYRREQKALHELCMRVKGDAQAKRENVIVACGGAQFGSTMRGLRGAPLKRFYRELGRYVTIVWVDEYLTSRVCSTCSEERLTGKKKEKTEKEKAEEKEKKKKNKEKEKARKRRRKEKKKKDSMEGQAGSGAVPGARVEGEGGGENSGQADEEVNRER
jgi:hypothetical protein